jgi:YegS/Rv2252/BmrU family lipid kinase
MSIKERNRDMKKILMVYNPTSGEGTINDKLEAIVNLHKEEGFDLVLREIKDDLDLDKVLLEIDDTYSYIIVAGGDGTVNMMVNAIVKLNIEIPLGVIPAGTANDFASHIGMPGDVLEASRRILESKPKRIDIGKINDKYFVNVASTGLFTDVSQKTNQSLKNTIGKIAYFLKGIQEIPSFKKIPIKIKSKEFNFEGEVFVILIFNGNSAGSMDIAYNADMSDGKLDVIILNPESLLEVFPLLMKLMMKKNLADTVGLTYFQTDEVSIETDMIGLTTDIDGEYGPDLPLKIECIK